MTVGTSYFERSWEKSLLKHDIRPDLPQTDSEALLRLTYPGVGKCHRFLYGTGSFRKIDDDDERPGFEEKEDPRTKTKEYRQLARKLEKMEDEQKINYLKKRLTNHMCSFFIEKHPELGLVADEDPRMVSEIQKRIYRISKLLDDSPLYSPFLRGLNTDKYHEPGWSKRQKYAKPYIDDIRILTQKIEGRPVKEEPKHPEIELSDMIYENDNQIKNTLVPEVFILRGLYYYLKVQKVETLRYASDKDISKLRSNHGNYRYALKYISKGIYNGAFSLYFISTFGSIFERYIQNYRTWLRLEMIAIQFSGRMEVDALRRKVERHDDTLKNIRKNSKSLPLLRRMYPWFPDEFRYERLKKSEIKSAFKNVEHKDFNKKVHNIKSRQMVSLFINLATFLAGSPLMRLSILWIRDLNSSNIDIQLQKRLIQSTQMLNNFYRMLGLGVDSKRGQDNAFKLLTGIVTFCAQTMDQYVMKSGGIMDKAYQRDPLIKSYTAITHFLKAYPDDKPARNLLHELEPDAERLLKSSVKANHIKTANTILQNIKASIHKSKQSKDK